MRLIEFRRVLRVTRETFKVSFRRETFCEALWSKVEELFRIVCKVNCKRQLSGTYRRISSLILNRLYSGHLAVLILGNLYIYFWIQLLSSFLRFFPSKRTVDRREQSSKGGATQCSTSIDHQIQPFNWQDCRQIPDQSSPLAGSGIQGRDLADKIEGIYWV